MYSPYKITDNVTYCLKRDKEWYTYKTKSPFDSYGIKDIMQVVFLKDKRLMESFIT